MRKKPTYHQMFDFLANTYGYQYMIELRDNNPDPQSLARAVEKAFQEIRAREDEEDRRHGKI